MCDRANVGGIQRLVMLGVRSQSLDSKRDGRSYTQRLRTISAGAFFKIQWHTVLHPIDFLRQHDGRRIAISSSPQLPSLFDSLLRPNDLFIFGSEGHGLPTDVVAACDADVTIPMWGETKSLNLAVAVGITPASSTFDNTANVHKTFLLLEESKKEASHADRWMRV